MLTSAAWTLLRRHARALTGAAGGRGAVVHNSLTGVEEALVTGSAPLTWYNCGPTVYDAAHLGHARTYVTLDVLRRVVERYCMVPVVTAMGVTDVDDKIIARAAEQVGVCAWGCPPPVPRARPGPSPHRP